MDSKTNDSRRSELDGPPRQPKLRSLAGTGGKGKSAKKPPVTPADEDEDSDLINGAEGESSDEADSEQAGDLESHPVMQAFRYLQSAEESLHNLASVMPNTVMVVQDLISNLRQLVPQEAAAMLSGQPGGGAAGSTGAMQPGGMMGSPSGGLGMLAGGAAGGAPVQAAPPALGGGLGM